MQDSSGIFYEQLGKQGGAESGVAISQLIEQGTTTLAKINDNMQTARMGVGNLLLSLIVKDMAGKPETVKVQKLGASKKIKFNQQKTDDVTGKKYLDNDVTRMQMTVVLSEVPQTPTFRMQQFQQLTTLVSSLPPEAQMCLIDIVVNASDVPDKQEVLKRLRDTLHLGQPDTSQMSPEELQAFEQQQQEQQRIKQLEDQLAQANADLQTARVGLTNAQTEETLVKSDALKVSANLNPGLSRAPGAPNMAAGSAPGTTNDPGLGTTLTAPHTPPVQSNVGGLNAASAPPAPQPPQMTQ